MNSLRLIQKLQQNRSFVKKYQNFFASCQVVKTKQEAIAGIKSGMQVLVGGFGLCGTPEKLIEAIQETDINNLEVVSNTCGVPDWGLGLLLQKKQIKKIHASYVGENKLFEKQYLEGDLEVEFTPQGTLAEKCRAGGAGIPAFYTPTGAHTYVEDGKIPIHVGKDQGGLPDIVSQPKERRQFNGRDYIMEESIFGDVALIKAWKADTLGNLIYRKTANNFNQDMATAAKLVIAEVEEIVPAGELDPNLIHTPSVYVDRVYVPEKYEKRIEKLIFDHSDEPVKPESEKTVQEKKRERIVRRCAQEVEDGMYINLGIGIPTLLAEYLHTSDKNVFMQCENGVMGLDAYPKKGEEDPDLINAGKVAVTVHKGASMFSSSTSFAMIRGGHLDITMLGAMEISETGDIANWIIPGKKVKGMGGAMDLVSCGSKVIVTMEHVAKNGNLKIMKNCNLPLTGSGVVDQVITDMAVFKLIDGKMKLTEIAEDTTLEEVKKCTGFEIDVDESQLKRF